MKEFTLRDSVRTVVCFWIPITAFIHSFSSRWTFLKFLSIYWVCTETRMFWFEPEMVFTLSFLQSQLFSWCRIAKHFSQVTFSFLMLFVLVSFHWDLLPTTLLFFGRNILIHLSDVGLLHSVPYTGWEVNCLLLHLRNKISFFFCYFEFS